MLKIAVAVILFLSFGNSCNSVKQSDSNSKPISHEKWSNLLAKHVTDNGLVDYKGFREDSTQLDAYLTQLGNHHPNQQNWSKDERLAYWINAYNAYTIELILKHYPVESIKSITTGPNIPFVNSPWDIQFIDIEDQEYDLNNIEHGILREKFNEPRIHFAINCASVSCPVLRDEAFQASKIEQQLQEQTVHFINNPDKNKLNQDHVKISKIFSWFNGDFTENGSLVDYLNKYAKTRINEDAEVAYMDYSWELNDAKDRPESM